MGELLKMKDSQKRYYKKSIKNRTIQFNLNNYKDLYILKNLYKINLNKFVKNQLFWILKDMEEVERLGGIYEKNI